MVAVSALPTAPHPHLVVQDFLGGHQEGTRHKPY